MDGIIYNSVTRRWLKVIGWTIWTWVVFSTFLLNCGNSPQVGSRWAVAWVPVTAAFMLAVAAQFRGAPRGPLSTVIGCLMATLSTVVAAFLSFCDVLAAAQVGQAVGLSVPAWALPDVVPTAVAHP